MEQLASIADIQKKHERLYKRALRSGRELLASAEGQRFLKEVDSLLDRIAASSAAAKSFDDYRWLKDLVVKWQVVFSSLNLPKSIQISRPPGGLVAGQAPGQALSDREIEYWLARSATFFGLSRMARLGRPSTHEEQVWDQEMAEVYFASDVLDGKINFASRLSANSYGRLEKNWLQDVKLLRAYLRWQQRGGAVDEGNQLADFNEAGDHLREMLVNEGIKARPSEFGEVKGYLEHRYLTEGRIDLKNNPVAKMLVSKKAERIGSTTGEPDEWVNWFNAETYVVMFYENIIPAAMDDDLESVLTVLKAFQYSKARENGWWIVNTFEAALAIYFLRPATILTLWRDAEQSPLPDSSVESTVAIYSWPPDFEVPEECGDRFERRGHELVFKGVMTAAEKARLLFRMKTREQRAAIESLFQKSRLIHRETTL